MEQFKYETHCHTKEASACATSTGAEMADKYKELGYTGIIVTDHFFNGNCAIDRKLDWREKVEQYCLGYENAKKRGTEIGLDVFFGWEYSYSGTDFLTYGLDKKWLENHPEIMKMSVPTYIDFIKSEGGMVIQAHPFRTASYITTIRLYPKNVDGIEVRNTAPDHYCEKENDAAEYIAEMYDLLKTSGSDSHDVNKIGMGGMIFEHKIKDINDFIKSAKKQQAILL